MRYHQGWSDYWVTEGGLSVSVDFRHGTGVWGDMEPSEHSLRSWGLEYPEFGRLINAQGSKGQ